MNVRPPHRPIQESEDFWYYPKEAVLLYENEGKPHPRYLEAKHSPPHEWGHSDPHGIKFKDAVLRPVQQEMNAANVELLVRLCQESDLTEKVTEPRGTTFLQVPKFLALFLEAKRTCMYKAETLTQAIILIQTQVLIN